ncbi:MAG: hypothetical protein ACI9OJ_003510, partial [Myxococcota bacterium]
MRDRCSYSGAQSPYDSAPQGGDGPRHAVVEWAVQYDAPEPASPARWIMTNVATSAPRERSTTALWSQPERPTSNKHRAHAANLEGNCSWFTAKMDESSPEQSGGAIMIASRLGFLPVLLLAVLFSACESAPNPPTSEEAEPRTLTDPAPDTDGILRVLVYHDMEGLAGQSDPNTFFAFKPEYAHGRELLTADVNAVVAGLFDGGADEVHVVDAHGSTSPEPDLLLDQLDPRAEMVFKDHPFEPYMDLTEPGLYDAIAVVGMHAKTGSRGFASHTFTIGMGVILNGMSITETEVIGYSWGRVDTPVIFASGDDRLASDLET